MHVYVLVEDLGLSGIARARLGAELRELGPASGEVPSRRNHWRERLDGLAVILEADFEESSIGVAGLKARLVRLLGVAASSVSYAASTPAEGESAVFRHNSVDRLRVLVFGGRGASWAESNAATRAYLGLHGADWGET